MERSQHPSAIFGKIDDWRFFNPIELPPSVTTRGGWRFKPAEAEAVSQEVPQQSSEPEKAVGGGGGQAESPALLGRRVHPRGDRRAAGQVSGIGLPRSLFFESKIAVQEGRTGFNTGN